MLIREMLIRIVSVANGHHGRRGGVLTKRSVPGLHLRLNSRGRRHLVVALRVVHRRWGRELAGVHGLRRRRLVVVIRADSEALVRVHLRGRDLRLEWVGTKYGIRLICQLLGRRHYFPLILLRARFARARSPLACFPLSH